MVKGLKIPGIVGKFLLFGRKFQKLAKIFEQFLPKFEGLTAICPACRQRYVWLDGKIEAVSWIDGEMITFNFEHAMGRMHQFQGIWNDKQCRFDHVRVATFGLDIFARAPFLTASEATAWQKSEDPGYFFETHLESMFS